MSDLTAASVAERHRRLSEEFLALAEGVEDWDAPTPVPEWKAEDVVAHLAWLPGMLESMGSQLEVPSADLPLDQLREQSRVVQAVLDGPDADTVIETGFMGSLPLSQVIDRFYSFDLYAHAWDLARASGQEITLDEDYAQGAFEGMSAMGPALHASGEFGTPQPAADDAPPSQKLLALIGRDPHWRP